MVQFDLTFALLPHKELITVQKFILGLSKKSGIQIHCSSHLERVPRSALKGCIPYA